MICVNGISPTERGHTEKKSTSNAIKTRLYTTLIVGIATYTSETWAIRTYETRRRADVFVMLWLLKSSQRYS